MDVSPSIAAYADDAGTPRSLAKRRSPQHRGASASPQHQPRRATTGHEDHQQLEWLAEKLAKELAEARQREARVVREAEAAAHNMHELQAAVGLLYRENASLKARLAAAEAGDRGGRSSPTAAAATAAGSAPAPAELPALCQSTLSHLEAWFDDRAGLERTVSDKQGEIDALADTVRTLTALVDAEGWR
eukprot:Rhum_TRINITY_DN11660_c0_g1::Rhum_TRINITY_DN11660_c0_g1_i3::g.45872::m.45872